MAVVPHLSINCLMNGSACDAANRILNGVAKVRRATNSRRIFGVTFEHLGKLNPIHLGHLQDLIDCFSVLISWLDSPRVHVLGLAESGIVPSFAMHQSCFMHGHSSQWFCSTRSIASPIRFEEPHSHAPQHFLSQVVFDHSADELWIVEDEITSGRTLDNLLKCIQPICNGRSIRIFSMLETRARKDIDSFQQTWKEHGISVSTYSILSADPSFWCDDLVVGQPVQQRLQPASLSVGESIASALPLLVAGDIRSTQHVTLSPWMVDGHSIISKQHHQEGYYLYNVQ
jgi:Phosphoribosyl transferase